MKSRHKNAPNKTSKLGKIQVQTLQFSLVYRKINKKFQIILSKRMQDVKTVREICLNVSKLGGTFHRKLNPRQNDSWQRLRSLKAGCTGAVSFNAGCIEQVFCPTPWKWKAIVADPSYRFRVKRKNNALYFW